MPLPSSTGLKDITKSINSGFQHSKNGFVIIITIGFEEISKFLFFSCPCERPWNFRYGLLFIFGPAFLLWLVGILAQEKLWMLLTGLLRRKHIQLTNSSQIRRSDPNIDTLNPRRWWRKPVAFARIMIGIVMKGIMVPACWILICFLRGDYYVCAFYPDPDPDKSETLTILARCISRISKRKSTQQTSLMKCSEISTECRI